MALSGTDLEKLSELAQFEYKDQAIWFLNAYWDRVEPEAEKFWQYVQKIADLDHAKKAEGNAVDELQAHRFLEYFEMTQTVREMRDQLRKIGIDKVKLIALIHIIMFYYDVDFSEMVNASQGDTTAELEAAQAKLEEVQAKLEEVRATAAQAKEAEAAAKEAEAEAKASEAAAKEAEAAAKEAQAELEAALAELKAQEEAYSNRTKELEKKSEEGGVVSRNRAKNELAQHLGEDPLPLRRAKINMEAAVRKAERAAKAATAAREQAEKDRAEAEENRAKAEEAAAEAEAAVDEALVAMEEAEAAIQEAQKNAGSGGQGQLWWLQRQLEEDRKYLPTSRGGIRK